MSFEAERAERREQKEEEEEMREAGQSEEERRDDACGGKVNERQRGLVKTSNLSTVLKIKARN